MGGAAPGPERGGVSANSMRWGLSQGLPWKCIHVGWVYRGLGHPRKVYMGAGASWGSMQGFACPLLCPLGSPNMLHAEWTCVWYEAGRRGET